MSTLRANTLSNSAGTGSPAITGGELSRARFNLNGTGTIAERGSFNIASYVDNGVGDYTSNFTTAFPNANYTLAGIMGPTIGSSAEGIRPVSQATGAHRNTVNSNTTPTDFPVIMLSTHGDRP